MSEILSPQVRYEPERDTFWREMDEEIQDLSGEETVVIGADFDATFTERSRTC